MFFNFCAELKPRFLNQRSLLLTGRKTAAAASKIFQNKSTGYNKKSHLRHMFSGLPCSFVRLGTKEKQNTKVYKINK